MSSDLAIELEAKKIEDREWSYLETLSEKSNPVDSSEDEMDIKRQEVEDSETYQAEKAESNYFSQFESN